MVCMCITIITDLAGSCSNTQSPHSLRRRNDIGSVHKEGYNNCNNILHIYVLQELDTQRGVKSSWLGDILSQPNPSPQDHLPDIIRVTK